MDNYNIITPSSKFKHLSFQHYEYIIREITKHDAFFHQNKIVLKPIDLPRMIKRISNKN